MHVFAPSSARGLLRDLKRFQTSFSGHKCIINVGGRAPPGPAGELKRSPRPPSRNGGEKLRSLAAVWCPLRGRGGDKLKCVKWAELNEKGVFQTRHRQLFEIQVKMHVLAPSSARGLLRELK